MRILFILENYYPNIGGVETLFRNLAGELANKGHTVSVLTNKIRRDLPFKERQGQLTIYRYPFLNRYIFTLLAFFPAIILSAKHDLVHTTSYNAGFPAFFAGLLTGKKVIITFHEVWGKMWMEMPFFNKIKLWLYYCYEWLLLQLPFYRFVAVSEFTRQQLLHRGIRQGRIVRIYNGIDYRKFDAVKSEDKFDKGDQFTFLYYGRLGISKGLDILLRAFPILVKEKLNVKLILIIPYKPKSLFREVTHLINRMQIEEHVFLFHELTEVELFKKVSSADCVVIPSYSEGFGFAAVESNALDKPVVSSGRGSLQEIVSGEYIFYADQEPLQLSAALRKAVHGEWNVSDLKYFRMEDTVENYVKLYGTITDVINKSV